MKENSQENRFTNMQIVTSTVEKVEGSECTPCLSNRLGESAYQVGVTGLKKWVLCMYKGPHLSLTSDNKLVITC